MSTIPTDRMLQLMSPTDRASLGKVGRLASECQAEIEAKSEKQLQNEIENWLRLNGIPAFRQRMDKRSNMPIGTPDFLICYKGRFVAIEVKVGSNQPAKEQEAKLADIHKAGGSCEVIKSLPELKAFLGGLKPYATETLTPFPKVKDE